MNREQREAQLKTVLIGNFGQLVHLYQKATHKLAFGVLAGEMIEAILNKEFPWGQRERPKPRMPR